MLKYSYYKPRGLEFETRIKPDNMDWFDIPNYEQSFKTNFKIIIKDLPFAYYNYTLSLRLRVKSKTADTLWSEANIARFQTKSCLPENPPSTDVGSFYIYKNNVTIYWKPLPRQKHNGPNFKYIFSEIKRNGRAM